MASSAASWQRPALRQTTHLIGEAGITHQEVHPTFPWVLYVTAQQTLYNYDYSTQRVVSTRSLKDVFLPGDKSRPYTAAPGTNSMNNRVTLVNSTISKLPAYCGSYNPSKPPIPSNHTSSSSSLPYGNVKSISYADYSSVQSKWQGYRRNPPLHHTFHSNALVTIICDSGIAFHDLAANTTKLITTADLEKSSPVCVEFIHYDLCAIGCADGVIRLWDTTNWRFVRGLLAHSKSSKGNEVCTLKSLPEDTTSNSNTFRFLSFAHDSVGLVWMGTVSNGITDVTEPCAIIKNPKKDSMFASTSSVPVAQYMDNATSLLYSVSSNHKTRVWDLSYLPSLVSSRPSSSRSYSTTSRTNRMSSNSADGTKKRRGSFREKMKGMFKGKSAEQGTLIQIPCVSVIKPKATLPQLGKLSSCSIMMNSFLFPSGYALVLTNRTDCVYIAVSYSTARVGTDKSLEDAPSETASNHSGSSADGGGAGSNKMLHLVEALHVDGAKDLKVLSSRVHPLYQGHIILNTSAGIIIMRIMNPVPHGPNTTGTHSLWGSTYLSFDAATRVIHQRTGGVTNTEDEVDEGNAALDMSIDSIDRSAIHDASPYSVSSDFNCSNPSTAALAFLSSVPMFYPSPSGLFCIVHWPQSMQYVVLRLATTAASNLTSLQAVDRGMCSSIGWIGGADGEVVAMLTPGQRIIHEKKKAMLGFGKKEEDEVTVIAQQLVFIRVDQTASSLVKVHTDSTINGGWVPLSLRGGSLLCMTLVKEETRAGVTETRHKSQFLRLVPNLSTKAAKKKTTESAEDPDKPKFRLEAVESPTKEVSSVSWMYKRDGAYCGVAIDGRVSILAYSKSDLVCLKSKEVASKIPSPPLFVSWKFTESLLIHGLGDTVSLSIQDETELRPKSTGGPPIGTVHFWEERSVGHDDLL